MIRGRLLKEENKKGATVLFSSHVLSEVQRVCDRVAIIKEGRIIKIEKMSEINENNYKRFKVETKEEVSNDYFNISGVTNLKVNDNIHSFMFKGDINEVLSKISEIKVSNIWVDEPDLEEIFLHYYNKED